MHAALAPCSSASASWYFPAMPRRSVLLALASILTLLGCDDGARNARRVIHDEHAARIHQIVREDLERGMNGIRTAAGRLAPGFLVEDPAARVSDMRDALQILRGPPPRGIADLVFTPMSFVAAVGLDGRVIARDTEDDEAADPMAGWDAGALFPLVRRALDTGEEGVELVDFPGFTPEDPTVPLLLFATPAIRNGERVGVIMSGTPLWREAQKLGRQLQGERPNPTLVLWVYLYRGDTLHHHGAPADLTNVVPDAAARSAGLARSPGGFTGEVMQFGRWYGYGVLPLPELGPDVGAVIFRADPLE